MKNISVTAFIHTIFMLALIVVSLTLYILLNSTKNQREFQQFIRYQYIADAFLAHENIEKNSKEIKSLLKTQSLVITSEDKAREKIEKSGETIYSAHSIYGDARVFRIKDNNYFIYIERFNFSLLLEDKHPIDYTTQQIFTIAIILVFLLLILYIMVIKKLAPLKHLHKQIEQFADGYLNIKIAYEGNDEIAKIAKSFDKAIKHIRQLISSKNLFMRNIMHELKTPITTSRIVTESVEDDATKDILIRSFNRMNELIEDLANIERITMYSFTPNKKKWLLSAIFQKSKKMLLKDEKLYEFKFIDSEIYTDRSLLALVIKNLVDNGIKYSPNNFASVVVVGNKIIIKSKGNRLKEELSYYTEPFSQEEKRSTGFGLGLYIVSNISEKLDYNFRYRYDQENGENIFEIVLD